MRERRNDKDDCIRFNEFLIIDDYWIFTDRIKLNEFRIKRNISHMIRITNSNIRAMRMTSNLK